MCGGVLLSKKRERRSEGKDEREMLASPDASPEEESAHTAIWSRADG